MTRTMLCQDTLAAVSRSLPTPTYDRSSLRVGIVHIGVGMFHRSHQAMVVDDLLAQGKARGWAICGVGLLDSDRSMRDVMRVQDCLYTTVVKHPDGRRDARVIGSIVEDNFTLGRPPLEDAGVQMVDDVTPYFGYLSGHRSAHEASSDPVIAEFLLSYLLNEAIPTLRPVPGIDLDSYCHQLIDRFQNPEVRDTLAWLCAESSDRIPKWLLPVVREQLAGAGAVTLSAAIVASWARYAEATDEQGDPIDVVDPLKDQLVALAQTQRYNPLAFIENRALFGDLADDPRFTDPYLATLIALFTVGAHGTVRSLTSLRSAP